MTQLSLHLARKARNQGIAKVSGNNQVFLETCRGIARLICREKGQVTMDEVRAEADRIGIKPTHHNAYGGVFHKSEFECIGFTVSKQVQGHGNLVRIWRLRK